jgi:hypothetical protein
LSGVLIEPTRKNTFIFDGTLRDKCIPDGFKNERCLFDTGASYCHMPFKMWKRLGFARHILTAKTELFKGIGVTLPFLEGLIFNDVPCEHVISTIGDGSNIPAFEFVLDCLEFRTVKYPNVVIRVIDSSDNIFLVGNNVLSMSKFTWTPDLSGDTNGAFYLEFDKDHERLYRDYNDRQDKFMFLSDL